MSEREKFEQYWCAKYGCSNDDYWFEDGIYGDPDMQAAWETWQAAQEGSAILPNELTPVIKSVLGMMCFQIGHYAHVYQAAGFDIPKKAEEEQAFCLHRWLLVALEHGENWPRVVHQEIEDFAAKAQENK